MSARFELQTIWAAPASAHSIQMVLGFVATAPFYISEYYYSGGYPQGVPKAVFRMMWLETTLLSLVALSLLRTPFAHATRQWIAPFLLKLTAMIVIAIAWVFIVIDQMPCFSGGRGC